MKYRVLIFIITLILASCSSKAKKQEEEYKSPNIIYILADDLGYGDLSCYGQTKFQTPNIDKLASQGMKFTQHYSGSTVCAPSRCALLTGYHTGHAYVRGNRELKGTEGQLPMPDTLYTMAEMFKEAGYVTGAFGKWGLGFPGSEGDPNMQGFDVFYGYNCQRMAHRYYPPYLWDNQKKDSLEGNDWINTVTYAPDVVQERTLKFMEDNKDKPFFMYVPIIQPHAELIAPDDSILAKFKGKFGEEEPFVAKPNGDYGLGMEYKWYCSQEYPKATFAAMAYRIDVYVGQIMNKLKELGIEDNTLIMFTSDNGPHVEGGANPEFFNSAGGLRGVKRDLYEGGIRNAFIAKWPGKIAAGSTSDHVSAFWDMLPTYAEIVGVDIPKQMDGISMLPTLLGNNKKQKQHEYLYWELSAKGRQAVRMGKWKAVRYNLNKNHDAKIQLYDLSVDEKETNDIAGQHPDIVSQMEKILKEARVPSKTYPFKALDKN